MKDQSKNPAHDHSNHNHSEIMQTLNDCVIACETCAAASLEESDVTDMAHCIELDRDCADICALASRLLLRNSELSHGYLAICEEACRACADECRKHDHDHCKACAEACDKCAEACHEHHGNLSLK